MKLILAIIQPDRLEAVKVALAEVEVFRLTVMDVQGIGPERPGHEQPHGLRDTLHFVRKVQLMVGVNDTFLERTLEAIRKGVHSGDESQITDDKIYVIPLDDCIRIRTGERGGEAI